MTALQKVNLGTPPTAVDGDTVRGANTKANANVDVLNTQLAIVSNAAIITSSQALTNAHIGKRVNINLASAGTINVPSASTCAADQVIHIRNVGTTVVTLAITAGSGDTISLSSLNPGESALLDTDGVHAWTVLLRGRTNSQNEVVSGNLTVAGGIVGAAGGTAASAGIVGERLSAAQASGSISSAAITAVTSIQLSPGEWDITANCRFIPTGSQTPTEYVIGISTVNNNFGDFSSYSSSYATYGAGGGANLPTPVVTANVTVNTTVYVVVRSTFSGGGVMGVQGAIRARRVR